MRWLSNVAVCVVALAVALCGAAASVASAAMFACEAGTPMRPTDTCEVW